MYNYKILSNMKKVNDVAVEVLCGDITKITTAALVVPEFCNKIADTALTRRLVYCGAEDGLKSFEAYSKKNAAEARMRRYDARAAAMQSICFIRQWNPATRKRICCS